MLNSNEPDIYSYVLNFLLDFLSTDTLTLDFFNIKISDVVKERNEGIATLNLFLDNISRFRKCGNVLDKSKRHYYRKNDEFYRKFFNIE